ncbi:MAG TPA: LemA family protein [Acholeplasma sp.]|jgi:LemA protein|nr:LemA family protein [Acholeplasma sp.]
MITGWIITLVVLGLIIIGIGVLLFLIYDSLLKARKRVNNGWNQIKLYVARRFDLLPSLIETLQGEITDEEGLLSEFARVRGIYANSNTPGEIAKADFLLTNVLDRLVIVQEGYPSIKKNGGFQRLLFDLEDDQVKIVYSQSYYNDAVDKYNLKLVKFPSKIVAGWMKLEAKERFEYDYNK